MRGARKLAWVALTVAALGAGAAEACTCVKRDTHGVAGAQVVFTGKVTRVSSQGEVVRVHFQVLTAYWGPVGDEMELSDRFGSSCRALFEPGVSYLVYGYAPNAPGLSGYTTTRCAPNVPLADAGEQLRELRNFVWTARKNPMEYHFGIPR